MDFNLEKMLADSLCNVNLQKLMEMQQNDINLIEWCFQRWFWLKPLIRLAKPKYGGEILNAKTERIMEIIATNKPELLQYLDLDWLDRQVYNAKKALKEMNGNNR